jgi:hypothetical protein
MTKKIKVDFDQNIFSITFVTASHTHRAQYIFLRLEYFSGVAERGIAQSRQQNRARGNRVA